ncbi:NUDIX hydrolase [Lutibacter flavus]|uniref:NUDIX domain-containing protein n=1 Tax=Lutibacter flavus TaxID=691689 RepID=A0A238XQC9_9FLAO|nr:NUDIX domain-containing protein [Lutibacter flavus]SNR61175.1 NUDIX domain-containing protein [Lutibacter flavus]
MYKVFVNDCPIILTDNKNISSVYNIVEFKSDRIYQIVERLFQNELGGICLLCSSLKDNWEAFKSQFKIQEAAGGKVLNANNEVLFIYRFNKWDLPKGKLEKGETIEEGAIREVQEECGITNLEVENQLETTYHIFTRKNKIILKITYWFLMKTDYTGKLTPQKEEGIEAVIYKSNSEIKKALENTYENIKLLF